LAHHSNGFQGLRAADLDEIDRQIVQCLQADGRMSITAIAKAVGLSHAGASQRLQRLFNSRVVAIGAVTNPVTHGYGRRCTMLLRTDARAREVAEAAADIPEAYYVVLVTGRLDVLVEFMARDDVHFEKLSRQLRAIDGVIDAEVVPFLDLVKWSYAPEFPPTDAG
jgi:Lrp/AsnC family transcriptional regulator for asnA, asnC and gidA